MKVLLTGGTGFLGSAIARELAKQRHGVRALVRKTSRLDGLAGVPVETAVGDVGDRASIEAALEGVEAVIHAAGHVGQRRRDRAALERVNVEGARNVVEAARRRGLRVVHTSSIVAIGPTAEARAVDETHPFDGDRSYAYLDTKRRGEELALAAGAVVLNPGTILGPGDVYFTSTRFVLEYVRGRLRVYTRGGASFCDVRDVAAAHVAALTRGREGERYIVAGVNRTFRELVETLYRLTGLWRPIAAPAPLAFVGALLSEAASLVAEHPLEEVNRPALRHMQRFNFCDASKASRELGYGVRDFDLMLRDTLVDHLRRGAGRATTPQLQALLK